MIATLRKPIWALGTLICLAIVVLFINLGFWQIRRLHERRASNHLIATRMTEPAVDVAALEGAGTHPDPAGIEYRRVKVTGHWLPGSTVLVRSRALNEIPGFHVLGIAVLDEDVPGVGGKGTGVVVNRGFAPLGPGAVDPGIVIRAVAPKASSVEIEGVLRQSEKRNGVGPTDPATGVLDVINRVDVPRIQQQEPDVTLAPLFVQQDEPVEPPTAIIATLPLPDVGTDGPHLSYAFQWFLFASVGLVGWPLLLRKIAAEQAALGGDDDDGDPPSGTGRGPSGGDDGDGDPGATREPDDRAGEHVREGDGPGGTGSVGLKV